MGTTIEITFTEATKVGGSIHAIILAGVDKAGKQVYDKTFGRQTLEADSPALEEDAVFKVASCTKLITTIAALQCVDRGLIGLNDSVFPILPELAELKIISLAEDGKTLVYTKPTKVITLRHLLTHSSGLAYDLLSPLLMAWRVEHGQGSLSYPHDGTIPECYGTPLLFEPGEGWLYGGGVDWASVIVRRLNGNISLEQYFIEHIWKPVGRPAPFPIFDLNKHPEYKARLVACGNRNVAGVLENVVAPFGENGKDEHGGSGLNLTVPDYMAVLADLISDSPKLLKPETIAEMLKPQLAPGSAAEIGLNAWSLVWAPMTGGVVAEGVNYGIGGLLLTKDVEAAGIPADTLIWSGFTNPVWQLNKEKGVAAFFATQILPPGDPATVELIGKFFKDFWAKY